jgi:hypothetical protein
MTDEYTGGSVRYYTCSVTHPINEAADPYDAECIDIIDALQMTPNEANAFKALWRRAAARLGKSKRGYTDGLYDAEKVEFYGRRLVELEQRERKAVGAEQVELPGVPPVIDWSPSAPMREELVLIEGLDLPVTKTWATNIGAIPAHPSPAKPAGEGWRDIPRCVPPQDMRQVIEVATTRGQLITDIAERFDWDNVAWWRFEPPKKIPFTIGKCASRKCGRSAREISPYCEGCEPDL